MTQVWSDINRFNQTGYSAPTIFPQPENYADKRLWIEDNCLAERREESRQEWLWEEREEARIEWLEYQAELKAERDRSYIEYLMED